MIFDDNLYLKQRA